MQNRYSIKSILATFMAVAFAAAAQPALAGNFPGAIFTTLNDGTSVNHNIYDAKQDVYLNGGPQNQNSAGLPDGTYYFQVTDPSGKVLLSSDDVSCRQVVVLGGHVYGVPTGAPPAECTTGFHAAGILDPNNNSIPVQLIPYDDTPNNGGEYKVWLSPDPTFPNSNSKTDNFKIRSTECGDECNQEPIVISGIKFYDRDMSATFSDPPDWVLSDWHIELYDSTNTKISETDTDVDGKYEFLLDLNPSAQYTVKEVLQTNWQNTTALQYSFNADADHIFDFGNIHLSSIGGTKYYDSDNSGTLNTGDVALAGIKIVINLTLPDGTTASETVYTAADGSWSSSLYPDFSSYTVNEVLPNGNWVQIGSGYTGSVGDSGSNNLNFLNVCRLTPGGHTLGFWSNKNGQALETAADFTRLTSYYLRNANGSDRDFTDTLAKNKTALSSWLLNANATNMAYMLSAQMTATDLSVAHGFSDPSIIVDGTRTVAQEITYANSLLGADGFTPSGDPNRTEQTRVKDILDLINNNGSFAQSDPTVPGCAFTSPY